ncbi:MAG TPA: hypothetical protein VK977_04035 [Actinomycetota bacterium]|nr:hypothetical protein [Actinomycetota bacterium]
MIARARALAGALLAVVLVASACTGSGSEPLGSETAAPVPSAPETASPAPTGPRSAQAALERLCRRPPPQPASTGSEKPTPPAIKQVEGQVQQIRGLEFTEPVPVDAASHEDLVKGLTQSFDSSYPARIYDRRSRAWQTIGVIPPGTSIRRSIERFAGSQVIGYYDPLSGQLVFIGTEDPTPVQRVTLAHELTHALDDQHFRLDRLNTLESECADEAYQAALGAVEGDATYFMIVYAQRFLTLDEQLELGLGPAPSTAGIAPFVVELQTWPYTAGLSFIQAMDRRGGAEAIDRAMQSLPVSTEQVIHPERYPNDAPTPVNVADLGPELGPGWTDLDVMSVGEAFLSIMLGLRLPPVTAEAAAAGWDGGTYRAWSDGEHVAIVLSTVWDGPRDAAEFASATRQWLGSREGRSASLLPVEGQRVTVLLASDAASLASLEAATA